MSRRWRRFAVRFAILDSGACLSFMACLMFLFLPRESEAHYSIGRDEEGPHIIQESFIFTLYEWLYINHSPCYFYTHMDIFRCKDSANETTVLGR